MELGQNDEVGEDFRSGVIMGNNLKFRLQQRVVELEMCINNMKIQLNDGDRTNATLKKVSILLNDLICLNIYIMMPCIVLNRGRGAVYTNGLR